MQVQCYMNTVLTIRVCCCKTIAYATYYCWTSLAVQCSYNDYNKRILRSTTKSVHFQKNNTRITRNTRTLEKREIEQIPNAYYALQTRQFYGYSYSTTTWQKTNDILAREWWQTMTNKCTLTAFQARLLDTLPHEDASNLSTWLTHTPTHTCLLTVHI